MTDCEHDFGVWLLMKRSKPWGGEGGGFHTVSKQLNMSKGCLLPGVHQKVWFNLENCLNKQRVTLVPEASLYHRGDTQCGLWPHQQIELENPSRQHRNNCSCKRESLMDSDSVISSQSEMLSVKSRRNIDLSPIYFTTYRKYV